MNAPETRDATGKDPVCGMDVDMATAKHTSEYDGVTYGFCSLMCKRAFEDDPQHYLQKRTPGPS